MLGYAGAGLANKRPKVENYFEITQVEFLMGRGTSHLGAIRRIGVVEQTYYRWRNNDAIGPRLTAWDRPAKGSTLGKRMNGCEY